MVNLLTDHPLSHKDVSRQVYILRLQQAATKIVSEMKLADFDGRLDDIDFVSVILKLLTEYPDFFYVDIKHRENSMSMWDLTTLVFDLLLNKNFEFTEYEDIEPQEPAVLGAYVKMNDKYTYTWSTNATRVQFNSLYPNVLMNILNEKEDLVFNVSNFKTIFIRMLDACLIAKKMRHDFKNDILEEVYLEKIYTFIKIWINMTYGILNTSKSYLRCNKPLGQNVSIKSNTMFRSINSEFDGHIIYVDTDFIIFRYFNEISDRFKRFMQKKIYNDIPWEEDKVNFRAERLKMYMLQDSRGVLTIRGYKHMDVG